MDLATRTQLEIEFANKIDLIVDQLVYSNFSDEDIVVFTNSVKTFMGYVDLKQFIIDLLYDKVCEAAKIIKPHDQARFLSYRKLIRVILDLGDQELIESLETYLAKHKCSDHFFVFLEEKIARGLSTEHSELVFIDLIHTQEIDLKFVNKFLSIIQKDQSYLIKHLLTSNLDKVQSHSLTRFISELLHHELDSIGTHVVPTLVKYHNSNIENYLSIISSIISYTPAHTHTLLEDSKWKCNFQLWKYIINGYTFNTSLVKNYCLYLQEYFPDKLEDFENEFLENADPDHIVNYALQITSSKKRKVLRRLIELKSEKWLVVFIKKFPEYKSLLPML